MTMKKTNRFTNRLFSWAFFWVVLVAVIFLNIIANYVNYRVDMTQDGRYTLSDDTKNFLENPDNLKNRLNIKIYLAGKLPSELRTFRNAIEEKLNEFKEIAGDRIEYEFIDPNEGTEQEQYELKQTLLSGGKGIMKMDLKYESDGEEIKMQVWPGAVLEYGGSTVGHIQFLPRSNFGDAYPINELTSAIENALVNLEYTLLSSINKAVKEKKQRIAFLHGHGELDAYQTFLARANISPYYNIADITINDSVAALNNVDGLIIASPKTAFTDKELYVIDQFVMRGGKLMCLLDAVELNEDSLNRNGNTHTVRLETGIDDMLFDYGLKLNDNLVVDAKCLQKIVPYARQPFLNWFYYVMASTTEHPMAKNVEPVSLKYTSEVEMLKIDNVTVSPILTSSPNSNVTGYAPLVSLGMPLNYGENPELVPNPTAETNKRTLGAVAEGKFQSRFRNRVTDEYIKSVSNDKDLKQYKFLSNSEKPGRVLLIGNGRFISNSVRLDERGIPGPYFPSLSADEEMTMYSRKYVLIGNQEFFQNMVDYMMGEGSVLGLRSRKVDIYALDKNKIKKDGQFYKLMNIIIPLLIVGVLAVFMLYYRKRKYAK